MEDGKIKPKWSFKVPGKHLLSQVRWNFLNKDLIGCSKNGDILRFNLEGDILQCENIHTGSINSFCFAKDYSVMATAGSDGCKILDPATFKVLRTFKQDLPMNSVAITPLICDKEKKYHCIMGGGVPARDAAKTKHGEYNIHICNFL